MRTPLIAAMLIAGPAQAAELDRPTYRGPHAAVRAGAWGGVRLRVALGARAGTERVRAGVALAPVRASTGPDGARVLRRAEGLELGMADRDGPGLTLAGYDLAAHRAAAARGGDGGRRGPSTALLVVGGVVVAAVIGGLLFADALSDASE